ncbi:MAG TPA: CcmD family protein [Candidatus Binatia bacterium]|nr:CcmD family protein [Candidatus Binatia bacterium]
MANLSFLFAAYSAIWVLLFLYVANISRRNRILQREIDELREFLRRQDPASGSSKTPPPA